MKLIAGLGNPGNEYTGTRHNVGFEVVGELSGWVWKEKARWQGRYCRCAIGGQEVVLLMPQTYMNLSGKSIASATGALGVSLADLLVIHDDLDLGLGRLRFKSGGGNAGHNGLRSISASVGNGYCRLRLGIGHPDNRAEVTGWVLGRFAPEERETVQNMIHSAADAVRYWVENGLADSQQRFNRN